MGNKVGSESDGDETSLIDPALRFFLGGNTSGGKRYSIIAEKFETKLKEDTVQYDEAAIQARAEEDAKLFNSYAGDKWQFFLDPDYIRDAKLRRPSDKGYDKSTLYIPEVCKELFSPQDTEYFRLKALNYDVMLFFKVGKFYEVFDDDADIVVKELEQKYVTAQASVDNQRPRVCAGIPVEDYKMYSTLLVKNGHKVARLELGGTDEAFEAVRAGNPQKLQEIIDAGFLLDVTDEYGETPIMIACQTGHLECLKKLLIACTHLDLVNHNGYTAVMFAIARNHIECMKAIVKAGCDLEHQNKDGFNALILSCFFGYATATRYLIESNCALDNVNKSGNSALMVAASEDKPACARELLNAFCITTTQNAKGQDALELAHQYGSIAVETEIQHALEARMAQKLAMFNKKFYIRVALDHKYVGHYLSVGEPDGKYGGFDVCLSRFNNQERKGVWMPRHIYKEEEKEEFGAATSEGRLTEEHTELMYLDNFWGEAKGEKRVGMSLALTPFKVPSAQERKAFQAAAQAAEQAAEESTIGDALATPTSAAPASTSTSTSASVSDKDRTEAHLDEKHRALADAIADDTADDDTNAHNAVFEVMDDDAVSEIERKAVEAAEAALAAEEATIDASQIPASDLKKEIKICRNSDNHIPWKLVRGPNRSFYLENHWEGHMGDKRFGMRLGAVRKGDRLALFGPEHKQFWIRWQFALVKNKKKGKRKSTTSDKSMAALSKLLFRN